MRDCMGRRMGLKTSKMKGYGWEEGGCAVFFDEKGLIRE
jgi:hypothetical protein